MGSVRDAFDVSVMSNTLVREPDAALIENGRKLADQIDYAVENFSGQDLTKALYLTPHLVNIERELLATPASRRNAGVKDEETAGGKLADFRAMQAKRRTGRAS